MTRQTDGPIAWKITPDELVRQRGWQSRRRGKGIEIKYCPYCGSGRSQDKWKFAIHCQTGQFKCMKGNCPAAAGGGFWDLLETSGLNPVEFIDRTGERKQSKASKGSKTMSMNGFKRDHNFAHHASNPGANIVVGKEKVEYKAPYTPAQPLSAAAQDWLRGRHISDDVIRSWELASDPAGNILFRYYEGRAAAGRPTGHVFSKLRILQPADDGRKARRDAGGKPILYGTWPCDPQVSKTLVIVAGEMAIMKQWFDPMFPAIVLAEEQIGLRSTVTDNQGLLSRETLTEYFDALGRKIGHTKIGERRLPQAVAGTYPELSLGQDEAPPSVNMGSVVDSNGPMAVQRSDVEIMNITYGADPANPRRCIILQQTTTTWKLILEDHDEEYRGEPKMQPLADAHVNGVLDSNANQTISFRLFETIVERTVPSASAQGHFGVAISRINHLAGGTSSFEWHDRVGNADVPEPRTLTRNLVLRVPGVDGYRARAMSCREVPTELALKLGDDELIRLTDPPRRLQLTLTKPDTSLDRGSVIVPEGRAGLRGRFLVLGTRLTGSAMGTREQKQFMRVVGEEMREGT